MSATFYADLCDRLTQQLPSELRAAGLVVHNTFIDFKKPVLTGARKRAQSEGANPILHASTNQAGQRTPSLWGDEEPMQEAAPMYFTVANFVPRVSRGDQALIDYWLEQPDLTANGSPTRNTFIDVQNTMAFDLEGSCRTPSLWDDAEINLYFANFNIDSGGSRAFDQSVFVASHPSPWEAEALECEVHQTTCDGTCTGCYWHTKNNSCRWGDECKFCHQCDWVRRTRAVKS